MLKKTSFLELVKTILHRHHFIAVGQIEADFLIPKYERTADGMVVVTLKGEFMFCLNCPTVYFKPINRNLRSIEIETAVCHGDYWSAN